jgi:serine/threonine protein kinase
MDNFHFFEEVGSGSRSTVIKARKKKTIEFVAVKRVPKAFVADVRPSVLTV